MALGHSACKGQLPSGRTVAHGVTVGVTLTHPPISSSSSVLGSTAGSRPPPHRRRGWPSSLGGEGSPQSHAVGRETQPSAEALALSSHPAACSLPLRGKRRDQEGVTSHIAKQARTGLYSLLSGFELRFEMQRLQGLTFFRERGGVSWLWLPQSRSDTRLPD